MPKITFIEHNGKHHEVEAKNGDSLMQAAVSNGSFGVLADRGGNCACATCHVFIDGAWVEKVAPAAATEKEMVEVALHDACVLPRR